MFCYINQLCTLSFSIELVKTISVFIVGSFETGLEKLTLAVAAISVDVYHFLAFSVLTCYLEDTRTDVLRLHPAA